MATNARISGYPRRNDFSIQRRVEEGFRVEGRQGSRGRKSQVSSTIDYTPGTEASPPTRRQGAAPTDRDTPRSNADNCILQFVNSFFPSSPVCRNRFLSRRNSSFLAPLSLSFTFSSVAMTIFQIGKKKYILSQCIGSINVFVGYTRQR